MVMEMSIKTEKIRKRVRKKKCVHYWDCKIVGDHTEQLCRYCGEFREVRPQFITQLYGRSY